MVLPGNDLGSAVILDLRGSIWESLHVLPGNDLQRAVILDFGLRLGNHCMVPPATTVVTTAFRVRL